MISGAPLFIGKDFHGVSVTEKELLTGFPLIGTAAVFVAGVLLVSFNQLAITLGILVSHLVDYGLSCPTAGTGG